MNVCDVFVDTQNLNKILSKRMFPLQKNITHALSQYFRVLECVFFLLLDNFHMLRWWIFRREWVIWWGGGGGGHIDFLHNTLAIGRPERSKSSAGVEWMSEELSERANLRAINTGGVDPKFYDLKKSEFL